MSGCLVLLGTDPRVLSIGLQAVQHNVPLAGLWASQHDAALLASLRLGCCAFPEAEEPLSQAARVVYSELPPQGLSGQLPALGVNDLKVSGLSLHCSTELSIEWQNWLRGLGFEIVFEG